MQRIAITGSSGYLGGCLRRYLRRLDPDVALLGLDRNEPVDPGGHQFVKVDMTDAAAVTDALQKFQPDTLVHHAFQVLPMHNETKMRHNNVDGSRNVIEAAAKVGVKRLCVASSATAFGGLPDNPVPLDDRDPIRATADFRYAHDKVELETFLGDFAAQHPEITVSWIRPCIVGGPHWRNYLERALFKAPWMAALDNVDTPIQLVHEEDVSAATHAILTRNVTGPFNVVPVDSMSQVEMARLLHKPVLRISLSLARKLVWLAWWSYWPFHEYPAGMLNFIRYSWVAAPNRLRNELGFEFKHTTRDVFDEMVELTERRKRRR